MAIANQEVPKVYPIHQIKPEDIVDTNGAGDAFAGGFMGALVLGKSVDEAVDAGHRMGSMCVSQASERFPVQSCFSLLTDD